MTWLRQNFAIRRIPNGHIVYWGALFGTVLYDTVGDERTEWIGYRRFLIVPWRKWLK